MFCDEVVLFPWRRSNMYHLPWLGWKTSVCWDSPLEPSQQLCLTPSSTIFLNSLLSQLLFAPKAAYISLACAGFALPFLRRPISPPFGIICQDHEDWHAQFYVKSFYPFSFIPSILLFSSSFSFRTFSFGVLKYLYFISIFTLSVIRLSFIHVIYLLLYEFIFCWHLENP